MTNFKRLQYLLLAFLVLSVSYIHLLTSSLLVSASHSISDSDVTYDTWYYNVNQWVSFNSSQDGLVPNQSYRVRVRFNLPTSQNLQQGFNINFTFLHQASDISDISLNVLDSNGTIHSGDDIYYSGITVTNNSALTRTNIQINNFVCYNAPWAILTFVYRSSAYAVPNQPSNGYIQISVANFTITEESPTAAVNNLAILINNSFADLISGISQGNQDIVNAVEDSSGGIIDGIVDLGSDLLGGLGSLGSNILGGLGSLGSNLLGGIANVITIVENTVEDLQDGILDGLTSLGTSILDGLVDLGEFVVDGIYGLFVPDGDDLQSWIEDFQTELNEECPIVGDVVGIFTNLASHIMSGTQFDSYYVQETTLEFGDASITLGGWDVPLLPDGFDDYIDYVRLATSIILGLGFLFMFYHKLLNIFGIESVEEVEHELDWYLHKAAQYNLSSRHMDDFWGDEEI